MPPVYGICSLHFFSHVIDMTWKPNPCFDWNFDLVSEEPRRANSFQVVFNIAMNGFPLSWCGKGSSGFMASHVTTTSTPDCSEVEMSTFWAMKKTREATKKAHPQKTPKNNRRIRSPTFFQPKKRTKVEHWSTYFGHDYFNKLKTKKTAPFLAKLVSPKNADLFGQIGFTQKCFPATIHHPPFPKPPTSLSTLREVCAR